MYSGGFSEEDGAAEKAVHHCVSPDFCQILTPENVQNKGACITVCITAAGSRVAKRTPGTWPGEVPQRVCATRPSVHARGAFPGDLRVAESPRQPVGWPTPESAEPVSLTGRPRGSLKTWVGDGYAWATPPPTGTGRQGRQRLMEWELSGWVMDGSLEPYQHPVSVTL